jgi:phosphohistidine swiveling domain-containing protein
VMEDHWSRWGGRGHDPQAAGTRPSAVVSDTGGVLSHCALVAREYRIPCVVGTVVGTSMIRDDMLLTVDSSQGMVRIETRV